MNKLEFKKKVLGWLAENEIKPKKFRIYNTRRYGLELRIYGEPMEMTNSKKSRRKMEVDENGNNCMVGIFSRKISSYCPINEEVMDSEEEKFFTLQVLRDSFNN